jgi:hypothetical protein
MIAKAEQIGDHQQIRCSLPDHPVTPALISELIEIATSLLG